MPGKMLYIEEDVLPTQTEDVKALWEDDPIKRLMYALMEDALKLAMEREVNPLETRVTRNWIFSEDEGLFSFLNICAVLEINSENIRSRVNRHIAKTSSPYARSR